MPIQFNVRVYKTKTRAIKKYQQLLEWDKSVHSDFRQLPRIKYVPTYKRWVVSWSTVYSERKRGRKRRKK